MPTNRLPLAALSIAMLALLGACSNATGPETGARRSGFITSSTAMQAVAPSSGGSKDGTTSGTSTGVAKSDSSANQPNSGYNVTAF